MCKYMGEIPKEYLKDYLSPEDLKKMNIDGSEGGKTVQGKEESEGKASKGEKSKGEKGYGPFADISFFKEGESRRSLEATKVGKIAEAAIKAGKSPDEEEYPEDAYSNENDVLFKDLKNFININVTKKMRKENPTGDPFGQADQEMALRYRMLDYKNAIKEALEKGEKAPIAKIDKGISDRFTEIFGYGGPQILVEEAVEAENRKKAK